jgi:predicted nucleotidyltransferase component of viral defense system
MKRTYDFNRISIDTGFNPVQIERVLRISDILENISSVPFLRKRLALYGGTALAFVHFDEIERLSVDIDFNYRHIDTEDWGNVRDQVDENLKVVLYSLGYTDDNIKINPSYSLNRFIVNYVNHTGRLDEIKIEIGYMRRIPVLETDREYDFYHIGSRNRFKIMTPVREELFSNKWCTMLYRGSPKDLFDVYRILHASFDRELFRATAVIDSLTRNAPLTAIQHEQRIREIKFDSSLLNLLYTQHEFNEKEVHEEVTNFTQRVIDELSVDEVQLIESFYEKLELDDKFLGKMDGLNHGIKEHPLIKWQIILLSKE